eukprot:5506810-Pyramimonas_sp.AAC.1
MLAPCCPSASHRPRFPSFAYLRRDCCRCRRSAYHMWMDSQILACVAETPIQRGISTDAVANALQYRALMLLPLNRSGGKRKRGSGSGLST